MEQMLIDPELKIEIDYHDWPLSSATQKLQPVVFMAGERYCCLLGPDLRTGIIGRGASPYEAVTAWEQNLHDRMAGAGDEDEVAEFVRITLNIDPHIYGSTEDK